MKATINAQAAVRHLKKADPVMAGLIKQVGPLRVPVKQVDDLFGTLVDAITAQQLSVKAAATIYRRFCELYGDPDQAPDPVRVLETPETSLRAVGLSRAKALAVVDLARNVVTGALPPLPELIDMDNEQVVQSLVKVRGIGRWTAEMFLLFQLGRADVLPVDDLGVRKGFMLAYRLAEMPSPRDLLEHGECWRPHCSAATWYLWQATRLNELRQPG
ncbi:DNA-3-methyladenine glycosylase family protein [Pseudohongiella sp. O18]|uniref:DNA-3-methyladenine glycosylase family protein n=1 Tax=Pseudohongiella sp. O18 TaxID=2904248 RepID=UPI001F185E3B|nr:DNA-3-methyladenine glycosylase [Pseudohongiella sp. O18]